MRLLGAGLPSDPDATLPYIVCVNILGALKEALLGFSSILNIFEKLSSSSKVHSKSVVEEVGVDYI